MAFLRPDGIFHAAGPRFDVVLELGLNPAGEDREGLSIAGRESGIAHHLAVKGQHSGQTSYLELVKSAAGTFQRLFAGRSGNDELGDERIERSADYITGLHAGIHAHAGAACGLKNVHRAGSGQKAAAGILAVYAKFERVSLGRRVAIGELAALGQTKLFPHQVDAGDLFGDGVLNLQARIDLQKGDGTVLTDEKLAGTSAEVADLLENGLRRPIHFGGLRLGKKGCGSFFDEFLVSALQRAVASRDDHNVAVHVGQALGFDMAGGIEVFFHEAFAATKGRDGLTGGRVEHFGDLVASTSHLEAAPAATKGSLDRHGQAVHVDEGEYLGRVGAGVQGSGRHRCVDFFGDVPSRNLVAELLDSLRRRPDPDEAGTDYGTGKVGVLG